MGGDRLHARHYTRRRHSHTGLKNSRTSTPPVHSGSLPVRKAGLQLCFGHGTSREIFLQRGDKLRYLQPRNPLPMKVKLQPVGCLAHCQTNWSSGRWRQKMVTLYLVDWHMLLILWDLTFVETFCEIGDQILPLSWNIRHFSIFGKSKFFKFNRSFRENHKNLWYQTDIL